MIYSGRGAAEMYGDDLYFQLAQGAAWNIIDARTKVDQLCCGLPGHTYGVLNLYKHTGESRWRDYACQMTVKTLRLSAPPSGDDLPDLYFALYKGPMGSALLSAEMEAPEFACMPLFESEGLVSTIVQLPNRSACGCCTRVARLRFSTPILVGNHSVASIDRVSG